MSASVAAWSGWLAAGAIGLALIGVRRLHTTRMEQVARACHELRGPLTAAQLGLAPAAGGAPSPARVRAIATELGRATRVVDDLTAMRRRRGAAGPGRLERIDVLRLVADALEAADGPARRAGVALTGSWEGPGALVWGDRVRLAQALGNVLVNAIEHGGGAVRLRGTVGLGRIRIAVDDDGPGLPAPVSVLAARARGGRGERGRGLAIALGVAHAHHGSIAAAPVGHGGRVVLELPAVIA